MPVAKFVWTAYDGPKRTLDNKLLRGHAMPSEANSMRHWALRFWAVIALLGEAACIPSDVLYDRQIVGRYRLVAIDISEGMSVCWRPENAFCVGDGLPGPAVFKAGGDDRYVVFARHPWTSGPLDRSVVEYYYIRRSPNEARGQHGEVLGPLDRAAFEQEARRLDLPDFTITIDRLE